MESLRRNIQYSFGHQVVIQSGVFQGAESEGEVIGTHQIFE